MLIFLYGEDSYRSRQKLNEIKEKAKKSDPQGLNITVLDGEKAEFNKIKEAVEAMPFLAHKRLVILENVLLFGKKDLKEKLAKFLKENKIPQTTVLVFWERGALDEKEPLFKILKKEAFQSENFEPLVGFKLNRWIEEEVKSQGGKIGRKAVNLLASFVGSNLWQMSSEIKKLVLYKKNNSQPIIIAEDVERLVSAQLDTNIFNFIDALAAKNGKQALKLLHNQIESGENEIYLLTMITYQFRNIILVSDLVRQGRNQYQISKETKIHPYVVKKTLGNIKNFSLERLKEIYQKLLQVDLNLKMTTQNPVLSLDMLVSELCE